MQYAIVFITTINKKEAEKISKALLDKRIIACSNIIGDIESHFWWKGKKEKAKECLLLVKTSMAAFKKVLKVVKSLHSYEVPEIIAVPIIAGYKPYLEWIKESTS